MTQATEFRKEIEEAFADVPCPGDNGLLAYDDCDDCGELANILRDQHWKDWKDKPLEFLRKGDADQHVIMTPEAIRFFYPLYLLAALDDFKDADLFRDAAIQILISPSHFDHLLISSTPRHAALSSEQLDERQRKLGRDISRYESLVKGFTRRQISAVKNCFQFLKAEHPAATFVMNDIEIALKSILEVRGDE